MTAKELYPDAMRDSGCFWGASCYQPIVDSFGEVAVQVDDQDYQGDTRVLYRDGDRYGWLQFGWGSCSGCDALQACNSYADVDQLISELRDSIKWFDTAAEALEFFESHDWEGDYSWYSSEQADFVQKCKAYLATQTEPTP